MGFNNLFKILDCNEKKSVPECIMTKHGQKLFLLYKNEECIMKYIGQQINIAREKRAEYQNELDAYNWKLDKLRLANAHLEPPYNEPNPLLCGLGHPPQEPESQISKEDYDKYKSWEFIDDKYNQHMDPFLMKYYNVKPFEPWVMLNISPAWAGKKIERQNICKLINSFKRYMKEEWYSEWYYTAESGGNGDHLHLHAVCKLNTNKNIKSCRTHISKNWKRQFTKHAKLEGLEGFIKPQGLQSILIQGESGEDILKDKLEYLIESKKPPGHENKALKALPLNARKRGNLFNLLSSNEIS